MRFLTAAATLAATSLAYEPRSQLATFDDPHFHFNMDLRQAQEWMHTTDTLVLTIVGSHDETMNPTDLQRMDTFDWIIKEALQELRGGYVETFYYECEWPDRPEQAGTVDFSVCRDTKNFNPHFVLLQPPDIKLNPYTGKPMNKVMVPFKQTAFSKDDFKKWVTGHVPNYSQNLLTSAHVDAFRSEDDIAHLYLFSSKVNTPPIYSALTS